MVREFVQPMGMPVVLFRGSLAEASEQQAAAEQFEVEQSRTRIPEGSVVIGRYSVVPFYEELWKDLEARQSRLINTPSQHAYVADLQNYVFGLGDMTPDTWDRLDQIPEEGPFVLKGATNSKKQQWRTHMYAANKREAIGVHGRLSQDGLVGDQQIYIRKYVPLVTYFNDVVGLPVTKEYRIFVLGGRVVAGGFYWANHAEEVAALNGGLLPEWSEVPSHWLHRAIQRIGSSCEFYAIDVAQTRSGEWVVIEVNDGQQAGLSCIDARRFYSRLHKVFFEMEFPS